MTWLLILKSSVKRASTASYVVQNWFDWSSCPKQRPEMSTACETEICMRRTSDDRRLIWFLSKEFFAESTIEDRCRLYSSECIDSISRRREKSAVNWTLSLKWSRSVAKLLTCESWSSSLLEKLETRRLRDFRTSKVCSRIQRSVWLLSSWFELFFVSQRASKKLMIESSSLLISLCRAVCRVDVTLLESKERSSKSPRSHSFVKQTRAESRSSSLIRSISVVNSLAVELDFGQKFKPDPRVGVRPGWTDQSSQPDPRVGVRRVLPSLSETSYIWKGEKKLFVSLI